MTPETSLLALDFTETAGQALAAAQQLATKAAQDEEKVATITPSLADFMRDSGFIQEHEKEAALGQLGTHEGSLAIIGNLLKIHGETKQGYEQKLAAAGPGQSAAGVEFSGNGDNGRVKSADAGANYADGGYIGRRRGAGEKSAADEAMIDSLGLRGRFGKQ